MVANPMAKKIMIVEDESITAQNIKKSVINLGFEVVSIEDNGKYAIKKAEKLKPDLVLMDVVLKGEIDGIEAASKIHEQFNIPVVYLTAYSNNKLFERAKLTDPYGFLVKPVDFYGLKCTLENAFYRYELEKESKKNLKVFLDGLPNSSVLIEPEGKIIIANEVFLKTYGKYHDEITCKNMFDFLPEFIAKKCRKTYKKVIESQESFSIETEHSGIYTKYFINPVFDKEGKVSRLAIIIYDISKEKNAEIQLKEAYESLEVKVQERTAELDMVIEELKRSNEELQQFAYVVSHDLQEPLRTIVSFTQLLERHYKGKLDDDADEFMDYIVDAAKRMQELIYDLLEYSRVAKNGEKFQPVDIEEVLNSALFNLKTLITKSNVEITHDKLPTVTAYKNQLIQLLQNLIGNAIKFKKTNESLKIHISAQKDEKKFEYIFSVSDNGIGIEKEYFDRIFTIFQRLHTREEYTGTGIGLSTAKKIIEYHGGSIWVESKPGVGSTFYFTIPNF